MLYDKLIQRLSYYAHDDASRIMKDWSAKGDALLHQLVKDERLFHGKLKALVHNYQPMKATTPVTANITKKLMKALDKICPEDTGRILETWYEHCTDPADLEKLIDDNYQLRLKIKHDFPGKTNK